MSRYGLTPAANLEAIDAYFSITPTNYKPQIVEKRNEARGQIIDEQGRPKDTRSHIQHPKPQPSYKSIPGAFGNPLAYVSKFSEQNERLLASQASEARASVELDELERRTTDGSLLADLDLDRMVDYRGYRQAHYNPDLPITAHREKIVNMIESCHCTIIQGMTGCGKTTQVPQYILDQYATSGRYCRIAVTQPRRIAAISIAKRVCKERNWTEGLYCGYQVARDSKVEEKTMISYMTTGILLQKLISDKCIRYTHVILDEVHERDQDTDLALLIVRKFARTCSQNVKVVLMSATFDCKIFADYFALVVRGEIQKCPVINVEGKIHEVQEFYWSDMTHLVSIPRMDAPELFPEANVFTAKLMAEFDRIELEEQKDLIAQGQPPKRGSVLVFLPGLAEIQDLHSVLEKEPGMKERKLWILPLHSTITLEEQARVFEPVHPLYRKVILSTNIAESSITVPDIKYVVDFCLTKCLQTDPQTNMTCLRLEWASKANCIQRKGRAGRVSKGRVYRLIHRGFYHKHLAEYGEPEMRRCPLAQLVLRVKKLGKEEPRAILSLALSPPDMDEIGRSILLLKEAAALADPRNISKYNPFDGDLTHVGEVLASLPLNVELGKLLVFGYTLGVLYDCLIIAAAMHTRSIFKRPFQRSMEAFSERLRWDRGMHSDPLATVNAFKEWDRLREQEYFMRTRSAEDQWCNKFFLQKKTLHEISEVIADLKARLEPHGIVPGPAWSLRKDRNETQERLLLKIAIACAFYPNYFTHQTQTEAEATKALAGKSPLNTVTLKGMPNNQGILYKRQLEQLFSDALPDSCKSPHISFENTKAYVEFEREPGDCGPIPHYMYVALHLSHRKERLAISLYDDQQAFDLMERIKEKQRIRAVAEHRLNTNRLYSSKDVSTSSDPLSPEPLFRGPVNMMVTHTEECGHFWSHIEQQDSSPSQALLKMHEEMNQPDLLASTMELTNPPVGSLCIAEYGGTYYRAKVTEIHSDSLHVFFIDYGNKELVHVSQARQLLPRFRSLPYQAVECRLAFMKPPNGETSYTPTINESFKMMFLEQNITAEIFSVQENVLRLVKVFRGSDDMISLLYRRGLAEQCPESQASVQSNMSIYGAQNREQWGYALDDYEVNTELPTTHRRQALTGPFSPIEMKFYSLVQSGRIREVKIEPGSVNAIALDEEPQDTHDRLMVAATASINQTGNKVTVRETTLMPNIHGLPALMCMLFAPEVQIRADKHLKCYTGAICGLGRDPKTGGPAFPDHDMEVEFDTEIDLDDVNSINDVRFLLNCWLGDGFRNKSQAMTTNFQNKLRSLIIKLLERPRKSQTKVTTMKSLEWDELDPVRVVQPHRNMCQTDETLFRFIRPPKLETFASSDEREQDQEKEYMLHHLRMLTRDAAASENLNREYLCELCNVMCSNTDQLRTHLDGRVHQEKEHHLLP